MCSRFGFCRGLITLVCRFRLLPLLAVCGAGRCAARADMGWGNSAAPPRWFCCLMYNLYVLIWPLAEDLAPFSVAALTCFAGLCVLLDVDAVLNTASTAFPSASQDFRCVALWVYAILLPIGTLAIPPITPAWTKPGLRFESTFPGRNRVSGYTL